MEEHICDKFRCPYYVKDATSGIGVKNCSGTGWVSSCILWCKYRNYAMSLNCTFEKPNGDYTEEVHP